MVIILDNVLLMIVLIFVIALILFLTTYLIIRRTKTSKIKKEIEKLDIERNLLVGVPILTELSKVKDLVKTDNLKEKLNEWDTTFKLIKDDRVPKLTDLITEADYLVSRNEYKGAVKKIANIEMEISELKNKSGALLDELKVITTSAERNRNEITKLKVEYRELQNKFDRTMKDYGSIAKPIALQFENIDKRFTEFEYAMDHNDYVGVEKIVTSLQTMLNDMKITLEEVPQIVLMAEMLIPKKIEEATTTYARMLRDGYPMDYLNVEYNIKEINKKISVIMDKLNILDLGDSILELKTILGYFDDLFKDFDKEKEARNIFRENSKLFKSKIDKTNKIVYNIYLSIDDIRTTYDLKDDDINKFNIINENLELLNKDFKSLIEHSKMHTFAYTKLTLELDGLFNKLMRLNDDLDYQLKSITSMKDDETRAREQLIVIENLLKQTKLKINDYKLPVIPDSYFIELKEAYQAIREINKELDKKPIVIKILNIRVDTARDLVFKIYNKTNDMLKEALMAEKVIVYGNRYRSSYKEIDKSLGDAEVLFKKGQYKQSLNVSINSIQMIERNIKEKFALE
ncbi:septation ring formation regulator EzrA [Clostridium sp. CAG:762]|nr:septation ring formation regulator EzrA [Clostridium sp. CAG:762]